MTYLQNTTNGENIMKKSITTLVATTMLLIGSLMLAPASHAEEPEPPSECEQTIQEWRDRTIAAEAKARELGVDLFFSQSEVSELERRNTILTAQLAWSERRADDILDDLAHKQQQFYRQFNKIQRQEATIRRLRDRIFELRNPR